jgi:hypothetical protein
MNSLYHCLECGNPISTGVHEFSTEVHGHGLCLKHQAWLNESTVSDETIILYLCFKANRLPVKLEFWNGEKAIDIAIPGKMYIEVEETVDSDAAQALQDFLAVFHNNKNGIPTLRISVAQIQNFHELEIIVDGITEVCMELQKTG